MSIEKCPGLNSKSGFKWWIPFGKESKEMTLCQECKPNTGEYILSDVLNLCNCDGFILNNPATNGIFNVSFWVADTTKLYPVCPRTEPGSKLDFDLNLPVGDRIVLFIDGENLKQDQFFQYEVCVNDEAYTETITPNYFYKKSVLDKNIFLTIAGSPECLEHIQASIKRKKLLTDGMRLTVKIMVYTLQPMAADKTTNEFYGDYTMIDHKTLGLKSSPQVSPHLNMIRPDYKYADSLIAQGLMKKFMLQPIVFTFHVKTTGVSTEIESYVAKLVVETNKDIEKHRAINLKKQAALEKLLQTSVEETNSLKTFNHL
jgi:hypothetical protein